VSRPADAASKDACPECKGVGSHHVERHAQVCGTFEDEETRAHFCAANCSVGDVECRVCHGTGILAGVPRAVYMARGGAAPVPFRGYA
jgi:DnaJ-class molecular chaperone